MTGALFADFERRHDSGAIVRATLGNSAGSSAITVLFGPSGSGKTTILRCLAGLDRPQSGIIRLGDHIWFDSAKKIHLRPQQRGVGYLFQEYALFPHLRVGQNIGYGLPREVRQRRVEELVELLGLVGLNDRYPHELSAGQRQRTALARAVAPKPRLLLLDEPLSALDAPTRLSLRGELRRLLTQLAIPAVVVTHDPIEAVALADNAVVLSNGTVLQDGPISEVFSRPATPAVARIVGIETIEPGNVERVQDGLATVRAGDVELLALAGEIRPGPVYLCIRGEEVILERGQSTQSSARNRLVAKVTRITPEGAMLRVGLDCGFDLTALITRPASEQLGVQEGQTVTALIKAPSIHLVAR